MPRHLLPAILLFAAGAACAGAADGFELQPPQVRASVDLGQIVKGLNEDTRQDYEWQVLRRTNIFLGQTARIGNRAGIRLGQMGVFFYVLPEEDGAPHTRLQKFGLGPTLAEFTYRLGRPESPWGDLQVGIFPFKYNPDASNLGEYLLRSGTYPGFLVTGGWNFLNSASFQVQGAGVNVRGFGDRLEASFLLPMESVNPPMHSISPTAVAAFAPIPGIELGAGIACNHCISAKPSKESPRKFDPTIQPAYMQRPTSLILSVEHIPVPDPTPEDPGRLRDSVAVVRDSTRFYTFQGVKLMARAALDPKALFGLGGPLGPLDLRLFAEAAVLGVKDYPFYYPDIRRRIPVMFGMNLPAFGLLDLLTVQGEFYDMLWPNSIDAVYEQQYPVPYHRDYDPANGPESVASTARRDRWHRSVLARKPIKIPITSRPTDWYYLFRVEVGI